MISSVDLPGDELTNPLDAFVPAPLFRETHQLWIPQPPAAAWDALHSITGDGMPIVRLLMGLRALPTRLRGGPPSPPEPMLDRMLHDGWFELTNEPQRVATIGSIAQFWRLRPAATRRSVPADEFRDFDVPGYAKAATSFWFVPDRAGTMCHTETRVTTTDVPSRRKMSAYWLLIRPGSGLIRRAILHEIARRAAIDKPS